MLIRDRQHPAAPFRSQLGDPTKSDVPCSRLPKKKGPADLKPNLLGRLRGLGRNYLLLSRLAELEAPLHRVVVRGANGCAFRFAHRRRVAGVEVQDIGRLHVIQ